jgi:D-alanine-D-alanine ligase
VREPHRVTVLAGGLSHERDVSLRSGRRVAEALRDTGLDVDVRDVDGGLLPALAADRPDAVFPLLHGVTGEDGTLRSVLALLGLGYVGAEPASCRVAFDKATAKAVVSRAGCATPESVVLPHETFRELGAGVLLEAIIARLGLPLVVKPVRGGSSLGASAVARPEDLTSAMVGAFAYGDTALVERRITGTEVGVTVLDTGEGPRALPAVEIVPDNGFYDYSARYTAGVTEFFTPARLSKEVADAATEAALCVHRSLALRDLSRSDLVVDGDGRPWFLEVNVAPGMTETSLTPMAIDAAGLDLGQVCRDLLALAAERAGQYAPQ